MKTYLQLRSMFNLYDKFMFFYPGTCLTTLFSLIGRVSRDSKFSHKVPKFLTAVMGRVHNISSG